MNDVCLLLEGTFPYVAGGVSTWVYDLIRKMDDLSFSIVYLGANRNTLKRQKYPIPSNVAEFKEIYLFDYNQDNTKIFHLKKKAHYEIIKKFLLSIKKKDTSIIKEAVDIIRSEKISLEELVFSMHSWQMLLDVYKSDGEETSFIDYFWTWRFIYVPLFSLFRTEIPRAKVYHAVSTGYAGLLGAIAKLEYKRPFLLTEHGIYTRERRIEIIQSDWIYSTQDKNITITEETTDFFKEWWIDLFYYLSQVAYDNSDEIITLFEGNRKIQIEEGAPQIKTRVIPNGVDLSVFNKNKEVESEGKVKIGFVGRVVPIKDVKTFIRSCKIVKETIGNAYFYIIGPTEEEEEYYNDCKLLVETEGMAEYVEFTGKVDVKEYYSKLDLIVLTSISEGQPLVQLEAYASGVPVVATDVGSCRELIMGSTSDDKLIGISGIVTPIVDPVSTAKAIIEILENKEKYNNMSKAAKKRVEKYYKMEYLLAEYRMLYNKYIRELSWQV